MGTERLSVLPPRYGDPFYKGREKENGWVRDHLKEKQSEGLEEVFPMELEGEMEEDSIPRTL